MLLAWIFCGLMSGERGSSSLGGSADVDTGADTVRMRMRIWGG